MVPPGMWVDPQLPDDWTEKDLEKLKGPKQAGNTSKK